MTRTYAISRCFFRTTISLSVAHFSAPRVLLVFGVREYAWTRISRLARMVNFCKQELPFYWASSATLLPPSPFQPPSLFHSFSLSLSPSLPLSLSLSLSLSLPLLPPHFTATPNATIGIPNRSGTIQHHCFSEPALLVLLTSNPFTPRHRARPRFFPQSPSKKVTSQSRVSPPRAARWFMQFFRFSALTFLFSIIFFALFVFVEADWSFVAPAHDRWVTGW